MEHQIYKKMEKEMTILHTSVHIYICIYVYRGMRGIISGHLIPNDGTESFSTHRALDSVGCHTGLKFPFERL